MKDETNYATPRRASRPSLSPSHTIVETGDTSSHQEFEETKALSETKPGWQVFLVTLGIIMSLFLVALDRTIVSTVRCPPTEPNPSLIS